MDTIQEEIKNNYKIKKWSIVAFVIALIVMLFGYMDAFIYSTLILIDIENADIAFKLFFQLLDFKLLFVFLPPIFLFIGVSKYGKNTKYIKNHFSYKKLLDVLKDEDFKMHKMFYNKEEFFYSKNWLYIEEVLIPRFLIDSIKVEKGKFYNQICVILKNNEIYRYNPRQNGKLFLDMAKMIDGEFKNSSDDVIEYFNPIEKKKTFKILNKVGLFSTIVGMFGFICLKNINLSWANENFYTIANSIFLCGCLFGFVESLISLWKRQDNQSSYISLILNIIMIIIIISFVICFNFIFIQSLL